MGKGTEEKETQISVAESLKGLAGALTPGQRRGFWNGRRNKECNTRERGNREMGYGRKIDGARSKYSHL